MLPPTRQEKKLGDKAAFILIMGQSPDSKTYNKEGIGLPFFQGKKEFGEVSPIVEQRCSEPIRIAEPGDILLSVRAPVGPTNLADQQCCIGRGLGAIRPNKEYCSISWLLYYFKKFQVEIANLGKGSTFDAITKADLENIQIPLPPLATQKAIVAKLDDAMHSIDQGLALLEQNIAECDALWQSSLSKVFSNEERERKKLGDISKTQSGGTPSRDKPNFWGGDIVRLKSGELDDNVNIIKYSETITQEGLDGSSAKVFPKGTLLMAMYGATAGKLGILGIEATTNQAVCSIQNNKGLFDNKYIYYFLFLHRQKIIQDSFGGAQPNISKNYIDNLSIPLPPLDQQVAIVAHLDHISTHISTLKQSYQIQKDQLLALKASILHEAFQGKLVQ